MSERSRHEPVRTCIVCSTREYRKALVRLVIREGCVVVDMRKKMPGRGAYLCGNRKCLDRAMHNYRNCLNRAFRTWDFRVCSK